MARKNILTRSRKKQADALVSQNRLAEARDLYQKIVATDSRDAEAWFRLGAIQGELADFEQAEFCCRKCVELDPRNLVAQMNLGGALEMQERHEDALEVFNTVRSLAPDTTRAIGSIGNIYEKLGEYQTAYDIIQPVLRAGVPDVNVAMAYARLSKHVGDSAEAIEFARMVLDTTAMSASDRTRLLFLLGVVYDQRKEYDSAFEWFAKGNRSKPLRYSAEAHQSQVDGIITAYTRKQIASMPHAANDSNLPVLIVGMPRSGTSLVEQIIASHPRAAGAGELRDLTLMVQSLSSHPATGLAHIHEMDRLTAANIDAEAAKYLGRLRSVSAEAARVTDKQPGNFLRLGFIQQLLPNARIIHCKRNPADTCLSCYFQDFLGHHDYAYDLGSLGHFYRQYERLMAHWKRELDLQIYEVEYEILVEDQERISREMINFLGLEWDPACLQFHKSSRIVNTASYDQVRQPMYRKSVERWRNYEKHLGPLISALSERV